MTVLDERPVQAPAPRRPRRWAGRRAVLRLASRDARRHRARSALVVAMVALPVVGLGAVDVVVRTAHEPARTGGPLVPAGADAVVTWLGGSRVGQVPDASSVSGYEDVGRPAPSADEVRTATGAEEVLLLQDGEVRLQLPDDRSLRLTVREVDARSPLADGLVDVRAGRLPATPDEVALTAPAAVAAGVDIGDAVTTTTGTRASMVGLVDAAQTSERAAVALPGALLREGTGARQYLLGTDEPLLWPDVLRLNDQGYVVLSRAVLADPPPDDQVPLHAGSAPYQDDDRLDVAAFAVLAGGMGLLEVVLLAGPAFAVGARRSKRVLALLAATGGDRRQVRDVVLAQGLVLGLLGSGVGLPLGVLLGVASLPLLERVTDTPLASPDLHPELLAIALVGLVTSVLAALLPARTVSRQDAALVLAGRPEPVRARRGLPFLGLVLAGAGLLLVLAGVRARSPLTILSGAAMGQVGLVLCTPAVVRLVGRSAGRLPLTPRLAVRDSARHVARTAPAVAAVMAAVAGTVASSIFVASLAERDERAYTPSLPLGQLQVQVSSDATGGDLAALEQAVRAAVDVDDLAVVRAVRQDCVAAPESCLPLTPVDPSAPPAAGGYYGGPVTVDDGSALGLVLGVDDRQGEAALQDGRAVVLDRSLLRADGTLRLRVETGNGAARTVDVPAVRGQTGPQVQSTAGPVVLPPSVVEGLGVQTAPSQLRVRPASPVGEGAEERLQRSLDTAGLDAWVYVERGYRNDYAPGLVALVVGAAVITVGAVATSTALAMTDARPDLATMAAVGASRSVRRRTAMATALVLAALGTTMGAVAGAVPGVAAIRALQADAASYGAAGDGGWPLVVPWTSLLVTAVAVPLAAGLLVAASTRSRLPVVHRRDA